MARLKLGVRLGPYEIVSFLGAGGMGEVYKAKDTRLGRTVALKVLPADLSQEPERRERFEREARAISSLTHPHICTLYDVGREEGVDFLVMEYLEGETLAERLKKGPLGLDAALRFAMEIADALDRAHRQGVVHRDLKPGNIMVTRSGTKLLDFGLAKLAAKEPLAGPREDPSLLLTAQKPLTEKGVFLGTFPYMSPELVEGREVDGRSDLFALGAVLYEMVTGRKAFEGASPASLIAAILEREPPPMSSLQPITPPALEHAVKTCLAKDPEARWQSAADLKHQLAWVAETAGKLKAPGAVPGPGGHLFWKIASATLLLAAMALGVGLLRRPPPETTVTRFLLFPPGKATFTSTDATVPAVSLSISPDGQRLAFVAAPAGEPPLLWVRSLDKTEALPVSGTEEASYPFWSPDGRSLGFFAQGKLKRVDLGGGVPQSLADAPLPRGGSWNPSGVILYSPSSEGLFKISALGGTPTRVTTVDPSRGEGAPRWPQFLPDGRHFLFYVRGPADVRGVYLKSLDESVTRRLLASEWAAAYAREGTGSNRRGYLLFVREGALLAQSFDPTAFELSGDAIPVAEPVAGSSASNAAFTVSDGGVLAYWSGMTSPGQLTWFDRRGNRLGTVGATAEYIDFALSPNETKLALAPVDPKSSTGDIWLTDLARGASSRVTANPSNDASPIWSPDGSRLVFRSDREGAILLYEVAAGGGSAEGVLFKPPDISPSRFPTDWSSDGRYLVYHNGPVQNSRWDLWFLRLDNLESKVFLATPFNEYHARFSPDGRSIAYSADESGRPEVYVRSFPSGEAKWRISVGGGSEPAWRRDGKELYYLAADGRLMSVNVRSGGTAFGAPQPLFPTRVPTTSSPYRRSYVVTGDGQRFLVNTAVGEVAQAPITVVLHWAAGLER